MHLECAVADWGGPAYTEFSLPPREARVMPSYEKHRQEVSDPGAWACGE